MKKYGNTNSEGLCTVKNPYENPNDFGAEIRGTQWGNFSNEHPELPLYAPSSQLVKDAENVEVELIWQFKERGMYESKEWKDAYWPSNNTCPYNSFDEYSKTMGLSSYNCDTRQIYRLLTVPQTEIEEQNAAEKELYYCLSDNGDLNGLYLASMREVSEHIEMDLGDIQPEDREKVQYTITPVLMTQTEFENLPEYEG